ncbi:MAG: SDR family NAD(P)-dependent oxidoreductase [Desulfobacteraceae bacterium]|jgi:benzil reductase ((S)-benzoin forming)
MIGYIITGTTRGLGNALVSKVLEHGDWVFTLNREPDFFSDRHINLFCDLSHAEEIHNRLEYLFTHLPIDDLSALVLINNAGGLLPVKPIHLAESFQISYNIEVNLIAPAILIAKFIKLTQNLRFKRRIINISSGASQNAYAGWGPYCSSKAGLNMLTKCVALEQGNGFNAVKISSFAPGVIDTDMQTQIRNSSCEDFPMRERFLLLKQKQLLMSPDLVAETLLSFDRNDALVQGGFHDIRDMLVTKT